MSEDLRRALQDAVAGQPAVGDWVTPVREGVRARRRRRALQSAAAGAALAVVGVLGLGALTGGGRDVTSLDQARPTPRPPVPTDGLVRPTPGPTPSATTSPAPTSRPLPPDPRRLPEGSLGLPRDVPGPLVAAPGAGALPPARPAAGPSASRSPAASPRATARVSPSPSPVPTAGAQQVTVEISPAGTRYPAGRSTVTVTATGSAEVPPRVLSLRVDGEPLETDPVLDCRYPTSPPDRSAQRAERSFEVDLSPGEHLLEAVADSGCSWYRGRGRTSRTVEAS